MNEISQIKLTPIEYQKNVSQQKQRLEMIIDEAYRNLGLNTTEKIGNQYLEILDSACRIYREIQREEEKKTKIAEKKEIKEAELQTEIYLKDSEELLTHLQVRDAKWTEINNSIINVLSLLQHQAYDLKNRTLKIKQNVLLESTVSQMIEIYEKLKDKNESQTMFRNLHLKKEIDDDQYILNQIKKNTEETKKKLLQKKKKRDEKLRISIIQKEQALKQNEELLKQEIQTRTNQLLSVEKKRIKGFNTPKPKIPQNENKKKPKQKIQPLLTQIIVKQKVNIIERFILYVMVVLTVITFLKFII